MVHEVGPCEGLCARCFWMLGHLKLTGNTSVFASRANTSISVTILTQIFVLPPPPCPRDPRHPPQPTCILETHSLDPPSKSPVYPSISRPRMHPQNLQPPQMT